MTPSARDSRRLAQARPHGCRGNQDGGTGPQKTQQANRVRRYPAEWPPFRWRWAGQGWRGASGRCRTGLCLGGLGDLPLSAVLSRQKKPQGLHKTRCVHTLFPLLRLSAPLTSLENASSPCETHPGVSSELSKQRRVFVTGVPRQSPGRPGLQLCALSHLPDLLGSKLRPETVSGSLLLPSTGPGAW